MSMRELTEVRRLLARLAETEADAFEAQDLDFKEWPADARQAVRQAVDAAVCMANGGGGTVVLGVRDRVTGREEAIRGVPADVDPHQLKRDIYERTAPRLTPEIQEIAVAEGTGRLLVMQVHGGLPPYTTTAGAGTVRRGKDCVPLTGDLRDRLMVERGDADVTAITLSEPVGSLLSAAALERLRDLARQESAPSDLLRKTDLDLLGALDVLRDGQLTRAGLLLAGTADAIVRHVPNFSWTHERMKSATVYVDREDGRDTRALALPLALLAMEARINADNPITTVERGLHHFEFRAYPAVALREALLNALCHLDLRLASPVLVKQFPRRLEISNPGGLIGGITPENILHHPRSREILYSFMHCLASGWSIEATSVWGASSKPCSSKGRSRHSSSTRTAPCGSSSNGRRRQGASGRSSPTRARPDTCSTWTISSCCAICSGTPRSTRPRRPRFVSGEMPRCATSSTRWCSCTIT